MALTLDILHSIEVVFLWEQTWEMCAAWIQFHLRYLRVRQSDTADRQIYIEARPNAKSRIRCALKTVKRTLQLTGLLISLANGHAQVLTGSDREVLEALYEATGGSTWSDRTNWMSDAPLSDWYGVGTNGDGRVTRLHLNRNGLSGPIPPGLAALNRLQELYLWGNRLSGPIPPQLTGLSALERLDLSDNGLSGRIPPDLGDLAKLEWLYLNRNQLDGPIPPGLGGLTNLQGLYLGGNHLSGQVPPQLAALRSLRELNLGGNQLSGPIPPQLAALAGLEGLDLSNNNLSGPIPSGLGDLAKLEWLYLNRNQLDGPIPPGLGDLTNLQGLYLYGNHLSGPPIPPQLAGLSAIERLDLSDNGLSGPIPPDLGDLAKLEWLYLNRNQLDGPIPPGLGDLTNLQGLYLGGNQLSGPIPPQLALLSELETLSLSENTLSGPIPTRLVLLSKLKKLELAENQLSGIVPVGLFALTRLQVLNLAGNQLIGTIPQELVDLTELRVLNLGFNLNLAGTIPLELRRMALSTLNLMATKLNVPEDPEFRQWLGTIKYYPSGSALGGPPDTMSSVDVAFFYTPAARGKAGGTVEIEAEIDLWVAETNQAFRDSGVNLQVVIVAKDEVRYEEENQNIFLALRRLTDPSDGYMDEVHSIRDRVGADVVNLVADVSDPGGVAMRPGAFAVVGQPTGASVFAHELGHNMGLSHDRYEAVNGLLPYSHGYVNQRAFLDRAPKSARWRTIMAYSGQCDDANFRCGEILRFSNPNQTYLGDPLGALEGSRAASALGPADAVRTLNITRHSVAAFRNRPASGPAPSEGRHSPAPSVSGHTPHPRAIMRAQTDGIFEATSQSKLGVSMSDTGTLRRREVTVNTGMLRRSRSEEPDLLTLNLFDDVLVTGMILNRTPTYSGGYALSGHLSGITGGTVTLAVNGAVIAGTVRIPGATFQIRSAGTGRHSITQIDPSRYSLRCGTGQRMR